MVAGVVAYVASGTGDKAEPAAQQVIAQSAAPAAAATETAALTVLPAGREAAEGTLSVAVTKTECGVAEVGPPDLPMPASAGQFCLVSVAVQNTGKEPRLLDPGAQRAVDQHGRSHRVAEQAAVFTNDQDPSLLDEIPPGAIRLGVIPFDVPTGVHLTSLMLHKSPWSAGVRVPLS
ncbi:DUF4352 domain-containing protein [Actinoplanes bogorensis]|uniref:DUF4352 domain-containing protein n=1 Tax=Paractinoplanes bogorensis TaxID=1610840 RepID=A0ABS5YL61_9ACTN|nr:DUF4352 domain-containing protein [Actinoplanes bogorensis]MBU2663453.1 DUF4352 domain-containing protein [Actinoplanes bogorensis]